MGLYYTAAWLKAARDDIYYPHFADHAMVFDATLFHNLVLPLHGLSSSNAHPNSSRYCSLQGLCKFPSQILERWLETQC
jgi:Zn-dependent oligopeptidase